MGQSALWLAAGMAAGLAVGGCHGKSGGVSGGELHPAPEPPRPVALTAMTADGAPAAAVPVPAWARETSIDVQAVVDSMGGPDRAPAGGEFPGFPVEPPKRASAEAELVKAAEAPKAEAAKVEPEPVVTIGAAAPEKPLEERVADAALVLTDLLNQECAAGGDSWRVYLAMAALEVVRPGGLPQVITPSAIGASGLSEKEFGAVGKVREFLVAAAALDGAKGPEARAAAVLELAAKMDAAPMRVRAAELCSKVTGYGQYTALGRRKFVQGSPVRAIVYVEVGHFANTPVDVDPTEPVESRGGQRYMVELGQTLELYHDSDGVLAWRVPEQRVLEISRNKRHDFFLVHEVVLPPTLTVGAYRLKVSMKDFATGQTDEATIPLEVVADAGVAAEARE